MDNPCLGSGANGLYPCFYLTRVGAGTVQKNCWTLMSCEGMDPREGSTLVCLARIYINQTAWVVLAPPRAYATVHYGPQDGQVLVLGSGDGQWNCHVWKTIETGVVRTALTTSRGGVLETWMRASRRLLSCGNS